MSRWLNAQVSYLICFRLYSDAKIGGNLHSHCNKSHTRIFTVLFVAGKRHGMVEVIHQRI